MQRTVLWTRRVPMRLIDCYVQLVGIFFVINLILVINQLQIGTRSYCNAFRIQSSVSLSLWLIFNEHHLGIEVATLTPPLTLCCIFKGWAKTVVSSMIFRLSSVKWHRMFELLGICWKTCRANDLPLEQTPTKPQLGCFFCFLFFWGGGGWRQLLFISKSKMKHIVYTEHFAITVIQEFGCNNWNVVIRELIDPKYNHGKLARTAWCVLAGQGKKDSNKNDYRLGCAHLNI